MVGRHDVVCVETVLVAQNSMTCEGACMRQKLLILVQAVFILLLVGCSDNLTEDTAKEILAKELAENSGRFVALRFEKGTPGYDYFQKLVSGGSFEFVKKEKVFEPLARQPMFAQQYKPTAELSDVFGMLVMRDAIDSSNVELSDIADEIILGKKSMKLREIVVCEVQCRLKREEIQSIDEILNDEKSGKAIVSFTLVEVPIAPYYDELFKLADEKQKKGAWHFRSKEPRSIKARFKKYDEGWRLEYDFM